MILLLGIKNKKAIVFNEPSPQISIVLSIYLACREAYAREAYRFACFVILVNILLANQNLEKSVAENFNKANLAYYSRLFTNMGSIYGYLQNLLFVFMGMFFLGKVEFDTRK